MPNPSRQDEACGPGVDGSRHRGRWALPSDRSPSESSRSRPVTTVRHASPPENVTVLSRYGRRADARLQDIADDLAAAGLDVMRADRAMLTKDRTARRDARGSLLLTAADPSVAAPLAAELAAPLLLLDDIGDPTGLADRIAHLTVESGNLLTLRLDQRPRRFLLAECIVAPAGGAGALTVSIDGSGEPLTTPVLRAVTTDSFGLAGTDGRRHEGPATRVGLFWRLDQPLADRMVPVDARLVVRGDAPGRQLVVDGDHDRFAAVATRVQLGPNQVFTRARLP